MHILTQADLLVLWEIGRLLLPLEQGILALETAFPDERKNVADWPIGQRNRALVQLHCASFGQRLRGWTACRECAEKLEFEIDGQALLERVPATHEQFVVVHGQRYRLPTSRDLAAVIHEPDPMTGARRLMDQCSTVDKLPTNSWTEEDVDTVGQSMAAADPLAEILLSFDCPSCGAYFEEILDFPSFVWAEIDARVSRLLFEVHTLALAYGWSQSEILSMSTARRQFYLKILRA